MNATQTVFIITLHPQSPEVVSLESSLIKEGLEPCVFPAVDGRATLPSLDALSSQLKRQITKSSHTNLTGSELGCYLSHYSAIASAFDNNLTHVTILEDDVTLIAGLGDRIREMIKLPTQYHHIRFMGLRIRARKIVQPLGSSHNITRPIKGVLGTQGYILNREGMAKVLAHGADIVHPIDVYYDRFWDSGINTYCVEPYIIAHTERPSNIAHPISRYNGKLTEKVLRFKSSLNRQSHLIRHRRDFFPHSKPSSRDL